MSKNTIPKKSVIICLDERGSEVNSVELSKKMTQWSQKSSSLAFIIGAAEGIESDVKCSAEALLSLSKLTLAHTIVPFLLLEQLYRGLLIQRNHPYHTL